MDPLRQALHDYWGYSEFRPHQEEIIRAILDGRDVAAVMPTGGGKSLCYQLPAVVSGKTGVVISPLIALMDDQIAQLRQMGIAAGALHSHLDFREQTRVLREAASGGLRLLYLSPERLAREDTIDKLRQVPLGFFAIDEAHCISEWGHEFRPEYRRLRSLREAFPTVQIAAFTASATRTVRSDIVTALALREPRKFIRSFFRSNLRYYVCNCDGPPKNRRPPVDERENAMLATVTAHPGESIIIYAPTIKAVEETTQFLTSLGIPAAGYHGSMEAAVRRTNQERWMTGEVNVMVGTLAFGLGINKPSVRAVIHLALPKSVEQYYQEAGRAGRDGQPADCLLLWRKRDVALLVHFINQLQDADERERSWRRYHALKKFVTEPNCRHRSLCEYFGESPKWQSCEACDICLGPPKFAEQRRAVTTSADAKPIQSKPKPAARADGMFTKLKAWRLETAQLNKVPAYVVFHDSVLADLADRKPTTTDELLQISGIGRRKADLYGEAILRLLKSG